MEVGLGFLVGLLAGGAVAAIVALIVAVSRRALSGDHRPEEGRGDAETVAGRRRDDPPAKVTKTQRRTGDTMIVENVDSRDTLINKSIQEVRGLLLYLIDVIGKTDAASGKAVEALSSSQAAMDGVDFSQSDSLEEVHRILVREVERVIETNVQLHSDLEKANKGIAQQRRQIEELQVQARIDGLTRIPNRTAFDERIREYIAMLERANMTFSLLLLDIDHFKRINDQHGHVSGDRILRGVAARITDTIRSNDFAARYGGEEFAVIFPGTTIGDSRGVAERVRQDVQKTNFRLDGELIKLTVSGGLVEGAKGEQPDALVARADEALYLAKSEGRNRLVIAG